MREDEEGDEEKEICAVNNRTNASGEDTFTRMSSVERRTETNPIEREENAPGSRSQNERDETQREKQTRQREVVSWFISGKREMVRNWCAKCELMRKRICVCYMGQSMANGEVRRGGGGQTVRGEEIEDGFVYTCFNIFCDFFFRFQWTMNERE